MVFGNLQNLFYAWLLCKSHKVGVIFLVQYLGLSNATRVIKCDIIL